MAAIPLTVSGPASIETLSRTHGEPDWLRSRRLDAWETCRTRIGDLGLDHLLLDPEDGTRPSQMTLSQTALSGGAVFTDLHTAARQHPDLVREYLFTELLAPGPGENAGDTLIPLNAALWRGGAFVYVPAGVKLEVPLQTSLQAGPRAGVFNHVLIVAEEESRVTFVESMVSGNGATFGDEPLHVGTVEIFAGSGASVTFCNLQRWGDHMRSFSFRRARVGAGAFMEWLDGDFGGRLVRSEMQSLLQAPRSRGSATIAYFGTGKQHLDISAGAIHTAPETNSDLLARGALAGEARAVYRGIGRIHRGARGARISQRQQTLLLSPEARSDAIPALVIDENEVEAGHAAAAGPLDPEQLFYLMSRGIPETAARKALIKSFFQPLLAALPEGPVRTELEEYLDETITGHFTGGGA